MNEVARIVGNTFTTSLQAINTRANNLETPKCAKLAS